MASLIAKKIFSLLASRTRKDHLILFGTDTNLARFIHGWTSFSTQPDLVDAYPGQDVLGSALFNSVFPLAVNHRHQFHCLHRHPSEC